MKWEKRDRERGKSRQCCWSRLKECRERESEETCERAVKESSFSALLCSVFEDCSRAKGTPLPTLLTFRPQSSESLNRISHQAQFPNSEISHLFRPPISTANLCSCMVSISDCVDFDSRASLIRRSTRLFVNVRGWSSASKFDYSNAYFCPIFSPINITSCWIIKRRKFYRQTRLSQRVRLACFEKSRRNDFLRNSLFAVILWSFICKMNKTHLAWRLYWQYAHCLHNHLIRCGREGVRWGMCTRAWVAHAGDCREDNERVQDARRDCGSSV